LIVYKKQAMDLFSQPMHADEIELEFGIWLKGPIGVSEQKIMEAAILHFILQLPPEKRPAKGTTIDVSNWVGGRFPRVSKTV
jgi:hypothetical protein